MDDVRNGGKWGRRLVHKVICPNCWHSFRPEEVLAIAKHPDLFGDSVAGPDQYLRFVPDRFNVKGEAIDPRGFATSDLACPRCHLQVPEAMLEVYPLFISIVGSPASGKSYFLATMTWELRRLLPQARLAYTDADPDANSALHGYEQALFLNPHPDRPTRIRKTERTDGTLHRTAILEDTSVRFPVPFQFTLWPTESHPRFSQASRTGRVVVLYDNAGEDFLPGSEVSGSAAIEHLARSQILFVLFDPTQEPRFRARCRSDDPQLAHGLRPGSKGPTVLLRQETFLREVAVRIRRYLGMSQDQRLRKPLIVIVPKFDIWAEATELSLDEEPYSGDGVDSPLTVDTNRVEAASMVLRDLFRRVCPEFVTTAENLSEVVCYVPVSSLGRSPELVRRGKDTFYGIRPREIRPKWVTVPLIYSLCKWATGLIGKADDGSQEAQRQA